VGWGVWLLAGYAFYLSICCTFLPAPTTWIVMLVASDMMAAQAGLDGHGVVRLIAVATVGAVATGLANLNEYHVFVYLLRKHRVAKVRDTRLYERASAWFRTNPFWILSLFSFLPIPVDVIRWLAITARYSRARFFWASFAGRWFRYAIWAAAASGLHLGARQIMGIQVVLVVLALIKVAPRLARRLKRRNRGDAAASEAVAIEDEARGGEEPSLVAQDAGRT
jgi:membrane protein YqaA with SNARE-associated domain